MSFSDIANLLKTHFDADLLANTQNIQPYLTIPANKLVEICRFLRDDERLFFDLLACLTAIDNGIEANTMEVIYSLTSIPYEHNLMLKVIIPRTPGSVSGSTNSLPSLPSVAHIWRTADWHEREAFDLVGIHFEGHPDLRRILLPTDWVGHPLRTDYQEEDQYHGIKTK